SCQVLASAGGGSSVPAAVSDAASELSTLAAELCSSSAGAAASAAEALKDVPKDADKVNLRQRTLSKHAAAARQLRGLALAPLQHGGALAGWRSPPGAAAVALQRASDLAAVASRETADAARLIGDDLIGKARTFTALGEGGPCAARLQYELLELSRAVDDLEAVAAGSPETSRVARDALFDINRALEESEEEVDQVHTAAHMGAETSAGVEVKLQGERGESGFVALDGGAATFRRGQADTFELLLPDVGRPTFLTVRSDGGSHKPEWCFDFAELTAEGIAPTFFAT
ncbi:hypothetical protein TSOC_014483, partial [Tetrabaena socialis]